MSIRTMRLNCSGCSLSSLHMAKKARKVLWVGVSADSVVALGGMEPGEGLHCGLVVLLRHFSPVWQVKNLLGAALST